MSNTEPERARRTPDPLDLERLRDPEAPGGTGLDDVNDALPLSNAPADGGLSGDDLNG